jgi:hypothetical protein
MLFSDFLQLVVIDLFGLFGNPVISNFVAETREIQRMTVRQMPAMREIHSQNLIAILDRRQIHGHVCLRTAVRLNVRVVSAKQLLRAIYRRLLDDVCPFTPAVVTFPGISFRVLVRKH